LDPRISYEGLKEDYSDDIDLLSSLDISKTMLQDHFRQQYTSNLARLDTLATSLNIPGPAASLSSQSTEKVDFMARYKAKNWAVADELEEYFKLPREDFETCDPLKWWAGRRAQFPKLYHLARDMFSIPGTFTLILD
jgi:hypothetical protein